MNAISGARGAVRLAAALSVTVLAACQSPGPQPLYYWGDYEGQLYNGMLQKIAPQQQIDVLEKGIEVAKSRNMALPPGYYAQLGLLWAIQGQGDKARASFQTEQALFPESKAYMDFLLQSGKVITSGAPTVPDHLNGPAAQQMPPHEIPEHKASVELPEGTKGHGLQADVARPAAAPSVKKGH